MPTVVLHPGSTVFVTGVNGLIGSHIADQLLQRGYRVQGAVRDMEKCKWLAEYFDEKYEDVSFELVEVSDMTAEGCYDEVLAGMDGFIHVASPLVGFFEASTAISIGIRGGLNGLRACSKSPRIKRFVFTSSSLAATFAKPDVEISLDVNSYNDEAVEAIRQDPNKEGMYIYSAMKTETEKAVWKWMEENKPDFVLNTILPSVNLGHVLIPEHQGFPSTIEWARAAWTGKDLKERAVMMLPQWFMSPVDTALLHVAALIYSDVDSERLFGYAGTWNYNQMLAIFRKLYPKREFVADLEGVGVDRMSVPNQRAEEVLRWIKGKGWDSFEASVANMSRGWKYE